VALVNLGVGTDGAAQALIGALKDKDIRVRNAVSYELGRFKQDAKIVVPALLDVLNDDEIGRWAAGSLGELGAEAKTAGPSLLALFKDKSKGYRDAAAWALGQVGAMEETLPALRDALKETNPMLRVEAASSIWNLDKEGKESRTILIDALKHKDKNV